VSDYLWLLYVLYTRCTLVDPVGDVDEEAETEADVDEHEAAACDVSAPTAKTCAVVSRFSGRVLSWSSEFS